MTSTHLGDFISGLKKAAEHINEILNYNKNLAQLRQKQQYDRLAHGSVFFKPGDLVKINNFRVRPGHSKAFEPKFIGPYKIVACVNEFNYELSAPDKRRELVHYNRMSHYYSRDKVDCRTPLEFSFQLYNKSNKTITENRLAITATGITT